MKNVNTLTHLRIKKAILYILRFIESILSVFVKLEEKHEY